MAEWANEQAATARRLVRAVDSGVLSTLSTEHAGYPFGSVTPHVMTHEGEIAVYVSTIAQHTANMKADPRVCLTVQEATAGNPQAAGRVSVVGDARRVPPEAEARVAERYFRFFPGARAYSGTHGFHFYGIVPRRVRYIGGFGAIYWIEPEEWRVPTPRWDAQEDEILAHMNEDHAAALRAMAGSRGGRGAEAELLACDVEGCHLRVGAEILYLAFEKPAETMDSIRAAMIALARAAV